MSVGGYELTLPGPAERLAGFAISNAQIGAAAAPGQGTDALLRSVRQQERFIGRPWHVWKNDPELARMVNDRLADGANDRTRV